MLGHQSECEAFRLASAHLHLLAQSPGKGWRSVLVLAAHEKGANPWRLVLLQQYQRHQCLRQLGHRKVLYTE